jgi:hypothetical protein
LQISRDLAVLARELLLLAPNSFEGGAEAKLEVIRLKFFTRNAIKLYQVKLAIYNPLQEVITAWKE